MDKNKTKVKILCLFLFISVLFLTSCNNISEKAVDGESTSSSDTAVYDGNSSAQEVIADEKYYKIVKNADSDFTYTIFNDNSEAVYRENIGSKSPNIEFVNDNLIDIHFSMGTGIINHKYYSITRDCISREYRYVAAIYDELIAYIYVPDNNAFENRLLVIRNIFDNSVYSKDFEIDFSRIDTPVIEAEFLNEGTQLRLKYYSGDELQKTEKTIDIY